MHHCPKCKSATLSPLGTTRGGHDVVPPSRCTRCKGVWLPRDAMQGNIFSAVVDAPTPDAPKLDARTGVCPACRGLMVRARVDAEHPFHLDRCPVCAGIWFDAGEWAAIASTEWLTHLDDLWDPVWRRKVREQRAAQRHVETMEQALGAEVFAKVSAAVEALREHPMRSLGLSYLIEELRGVEKFDAEKAPWEKAKT